MNVKIPNSRRNLDIAVNRIMSGDINPIQIRTVIANTVIGQMLPKGTVKGGCALKFRYGNKTTRFTRDFDSARSDDLDSFISELEEALHTGWNNFTGRVVRLDPAKPKGIPGEYIMQPFEIKLSYNGKSWVTVPFEVGHDEIGDTSNPEYLLFEDIVSIFIALGFPKPLPIALMRIPHQIAQKLHALSIENSERAHDLIDLQIITNNEAIDYLQTKIICRRLFDFRKQQSWPPIICMKTGWDTLYSSQTYGLDVLPKIDDAIVWANNLINKIENN